MGFDGIMKEAFEKVGIELSGEQYGKFTRYYELLNEHNRVMNLTALTEPQEIVIKHFVDSLLAYNKDIFANCNNVVDVGSGAGFPGLPLKILDDKFCLTMIESVGKKVNFCKKVVDELQLHDVECVHVRAEDAGRNPEMREKFDVAVARAVAPLNILAEYVLPLVKIGGKMIALKGKKAAEEIETAKKATNLLGGEVIRVEEKHLPIIGDERIIVTIRKTNQTPNKYPRKVGAPSKKPLQ